LYPYYIGLIEFNTEKSTKTKRIIKSTTSAKVFWAKKLTMLIIVSPKVVIFLLYYTTNQKRHAIGLPAGRQGKKW